LLYIKTKQRKGKKIAGTVDSNTSKNIGAPKKKTDEDNYGEGEGGFVDTKEKEQGDEIVPER
jgi:hypothetical protein